MSMFGWLLILDNSMIGEFEVMLQRTGLCFRRGEPPTLYDISGSAHFINKADAGIVVHRNWKNSDKRGQNSDNESDDDQYLVSIIVKKMRNKAAGRVGESCSSQIEFFKILFLQELMFCDIILLMELIQILSRKRVLQSKHRISMEYRITLKLRVFVKLLNRTIKSISKAFPDSFQRRKLISKSKPRR